MSRMRVGRPRAAGGAGADDASASPASATAAGPGMGQALLICALIGTAQMTWGVVVPVLPLFVDDLAVPVVLLGPIIAAFAIGRVIANVPAGLALRRLPARPMVLTVLVLLAAVTAVTGFVGSASWLIGLRLSAGLLGGAAITLGFAVLFAGAPAARRGRIIAMATIVQMGAAAVGSMLGGVAVTLGGVPAAFLAAAVPVLVAVGIDLVRPARGYWAALAAPATDASPAEATDIADDADGPASTPEASVSSAPARPADTRRVLVALAVVSFALFFARFAGEQGLIPVLAYEVGGLTPMTLGIAFALGTVASAGALPLVGRWVDGGAKVPVVIVSALGAGGVMLLFGVLGSPWWFGAAIVGYAVATSLANVVPSVVTAEAFPGRSSGAAVGVTRTAGDIGAAVGPLAVFALADLAGAWAGLALLAAVPIAAMAWFLLVLRRR
ncbi:MFS transporter [Agromyces sp. SYSU T00194]|uniref:MFS transporter n=1 Tax=Agromyces chitinivorans TaxID=3158560 RepID=UPI003396EC14